MRMFVALLAASVTVFASACGPNVVSSGNQDAGNAPDGKGGEDETNPYPPGPYGVTVNRVIENFRMPGYLATGEPVKVTTFEYREDLDLKTFRNAVDADGNPFRYLLLNISAGWCPPCNQEAEDLGLKGRQKGKIDEWLSKGGLFVTVLVEGYDESARNPPVKEDISTWVDQHDVQFTMAIDPDQKLIAAGINPSAFPTNLVIDLKTMKIVSAWYGLDTTYQKWEAALNNQ